MQSMINQPVSLCNLSNMRANVQLFQESFSDAIIFFPNVSQCKREKTSSYELPHRHVFYMKLSVVLFSNII